MSLEDPLLNEEDYQDFARALQWRDGFGIFFVVCMPIQAERLIKRIAIDIPNQTINFLELESPIDNLYDKVTVKIQEESADVLFIQGIEKSLIEYIKPGYGGRGDYYKEDSVPRILGHLNLQRERFRDSFKNTRLVFLLPLFALRYFISRAPDFFDWRSGVFEFSTEENIIKQEMTKIMEDNAENYQALSENERRQKLLEIQALIDEPNQIEEDKIKLYHKHIGLLSINHMYEEAIASCEKILSINASDIKALESYVYSLFKLGRMEEALVKIQTVLTFDAKNFKILFIKCLTFLGLKRLTEALASADELIHLQPKEFFSWLVHSLVLLMMDEYQKALKSLDQAKKIDSKNAAIWSLRGDIYLALKNYAEALNAFNKAIKLGDKSFEIFLKKSHTLMLLERYDAAVESCNAILQLKVDHWHVLGIRAEAYLNLKKYEEALADIDKLIQQKPNAFEAWHLKGRVLIHLKHYDEALTCFDKALSFSPDDIDTLKNRSKVLIELDRPEEAIESFAKVAKASEEEAEAWYAYSMFLIQKADNIAKEYINFNKKQIKLKQESFYQAARLAIDKALEINPNNFDFYIHKGNLENNAKNHESALMAAETAIELKNDDFKAYLLKSMILFNLKRYQDTLLTIEQAIALKPKESDAWKVKGFLLTLSERYQEALESFIQALNLKKNDTDIIFECAKTALKLEDFKTALLYLNKIIKLKPNYHQAWLLIGKTKALLGKPKKEILADLNKSVLFNPDKNIALINKANVLFSFNYDELAKIDCHKAILALSESINKDQEDADAFYNRACAYALLDDANAALNDLKQAILLDSNYVYKASKDDDFAKIKDHPEFKALIGSNIDVQNKATEFNKSNLLESPPKTLLPLFDFNASHDNDLDFSSTVMAEAAPLK